MNVLDYTFLFTICENEVVLKAITALEAMYKNTHAHL